MVIIGLIVGGVLVGQDLIKGAEIRATISQKEKFDAAANAFRNKYNCLPGDCATATQFGMTYNGNGNRQIGLHDGGSLNGGFAGGDDDGGDNSYSEMGSFWAHLSASNLIAGTYSLAVDPHTPTMGVNTPPASIRSAGGWWIASDQIFDTGSYWSGNTLFRGRHIYWITREVRRDEYFAAGLNPIDAFSIDSKLDDGNPASGTTRAATSYSSEVGGPSAAINASAGAAESATCVNTDTTPASYNVNAVLGDCGAEACGRCSMIIGASF